MKKSLKNDIAKVIKHIEEAHKILEEAESINGYQAMFIESTDSYLVHAMNDATHLQEKL